MSNMYTSKYPTIVTDKRINSVNESLQKKLTIEEYYDLTHHTHNIDHLISSGGMSYGEMQNAILSLTKTVEELLKTVDELKKQAANTPTVSDWDVTIPGNQDIDGNTLGDLMGFSMTEIE